MYGVLADIILLIHALFIAFVVFGFILIIAGIVRRWFWIENFWFRLIHLVAIGTVAAMAWCGEICPLTVWESRLREAAGGDAYPGTYVQYWLQRLIYYNFPPWVFVLGYTVFAALVLLTWIAKPPRSPRG
ncbi:MAG: DUF2784 domain-containing protein [Desulfobacterales bacterium]|nr:MAG: DUF2784 domain-containing protein [Desulfobacterales bacterium]